MTDCVGGVPVQIVSHIMELSWIQQKLINPTAIALLRRLRAGTEILYVHLADVCSAAPADLVANLMPAPGTDQMEDSYNSVWYFYCPKRYKNTKGKASGHRQRAIGTRVEGTCQGRP